jgi:transcriptional regulator with XRE-family HTH domain
MSDKQALILRAKMLGAIVREARLAARMSLKEAAALLGVTSGVLSSYEHGRRAISLPELELFAYHLDIPLDRFSSMSPPEADQQDEFDPNTIVTLRQKMIGALLRKHRSEVGMSIRALAEAVGLPSRRVSAYERGEKPVPLPELEALVGAMGQSLEDYIDDEGPIGEWAINKRGFSKFKELPIELRDFLSKPGNEPYLHLARNMSDISIEKLRALAETLLDITL